MAAAPPSTHSRTSSSISTSTTSSRSSSPGYRLSPSFSDPSCVRYSAFPVPPQYREIEATQPAHTSPHPTRGSHRQSYDNTASPPRPSRPTSPTYLSTSIERVTLPMLAHLNHELKLTHLEAEKDRVRRQIQRQETVLTLSMLLKVWGG